MQGGVHMSLIEKKIARALPKPILKWAGGKQQLSDLLLARAPGKYGKYIEPFFGGGAFFFALMPTTAIIADANPELIELYNAVVTDVDRVIEHLRSMPNDKEFYYQIRSVEREKLSLAERAARTIYLNRTCYNGLYRVNRKGQFNVPFGNYKKPTICDEDNLRAVGEKLAQVRILCGDYKQVLRETAEAGDFVFLDPPYLPVSKYADFKRYTKDQFYEDDHRELAEEIERLSELGCYVLLTNSNHPLVHELFDKYKVEIFSTRRHINCDANKRTGEDVIVSIEPKKRLFAVARPVVMPEQMAHFPATRYMGSKQNLISHIWGVASEFHFDSVLDLFSGSGVVSYMFKTQGKQVFSNDYMEFSACLSRAVIQNNRVTLSDRDVEALISSAGTNDHFVASTFKDLYFVDEDNLFLDQVRANIKRMKEPVKRDLAMAALVRACLKKRPRGIFTYTGFRYDDGRKDLKLTLREQFLEAVQAINDAVFDNGRVNQAFHGDAMELRRNAELVYIDPPYYSPLSDNEYVRRYHFVEGLARDWQGVVLQENTKTKKFKSYPTPFSTAGAAYDAFNTLFRRHRNSILIVSYSSNSLPTQEQILGLMARYKANVEVVAVDHRYSFGNQGHKVSDNRNKVQEYLFVGY